MNWRWIIPRQWRRRWKGRTTYRQLRRLQNLIIPTPHPPEDDFQIFHLPDRVKGLHDLDLPDCAKDLNDPDDDINDPRVVSHGANGRAHVWNRRDDDNDQINCDMMMNNIIRPARFEQRRFPILLTFLSLQVSQELAPCPELRNVGGMLAGLTSLEATGATWGQNSKSGNRHHATQRVLLAWPPCVPDLVTT